MKRWLSQKHVQYALISLGCPLLTITGVLFYQYVAHHEFWQNIETHPDPDNSYVAGGMALAEGLELSFFTGIACFVGFLMAVISIRKQRKILGVGTLALLINGLPFALLLFFFGRAWVRGSF